MATSKHRLFGVEVAVGSFSVILDYGILGHTICVWVAINGGVGTYDGVAVG